MQEAIESVFAQTYDNWELLLVDDGSTDGSTRIAIRCAERYPGKVNYLAHDDYQNRGASASRNLGIHHARGEFVAFLDADDIWLPQKLEHQVPILESQPDAGMMYSSTQYWYSWTGNPEDSKRDFLTRLGLHPDVLVKGPILLALVLRGEVAIPCTCSVLARRATIESAGGFEDSFRYIFTDQVFYSKVFLEAPVFVASGCWDRYRKRPDSSVAIAKEKGQLRSARGSFLKWLEAYLKMKGVKDVEVWRALQKELWPYRHPFLCRLSGGTDLLIGQMGNLLRQIARQTLPAPARQWIKTQWRGEIR